MVTRNFILHTSCLILGRKGTYKCQLMKNQYQPTYVGVISLFPNVYVHVYNNCYILLYNRIYMYMYMSGVHTGQHGEWISRCCTVPPHGNECTVQWPFVYNMIFIRVSSSWSSAYGSKAAFTTNPYLAIIFSSIRSFNNVIFPCQYTSIVIISADISAP